MNTFALGKVRESTVALKALLLTSVFATSVCAQENEARVPFVINVNATVAAQPQAGGEPIIMDVVANQEKTMIIPLGSGSSPIRPSGKTQGQLTITNFRGNISLQLPPQLYEKAEISLYSVNGRQILYNMVSASKTARNISHPNVVMGVYLLSVRGNGNTFATRLTHHGGNLNINVAFESGNASSAQLKKEKPETWTISVKPRGIAGYDGTSYGFYPVAGINPIQNIILIRTGQNFTDKVNGADFDMVYVGGGTYKRGCTTGDNDCEDQYEKPVHNVTLSDYYVGKFEVTQAQWRAVMGGDTCTYPSNCGQNPQTGINWFKANEFACELSKIRGREYRLPTDAEWEFAARGGTGSGGYRYSGSNTYNDVAWHSGNSNNQIHSVGGKAPNELGIYDMSGNVQEWVYDWLMPYTESDKINPIQIVGSGNKTRRGGGYSDVYIDTRVSKRKIRSRDGSDGMLGFRLAYSPALPPNMLTACEVVESGKGPSGECMAGATSNPNRDCKIVTGDGEVWMNDMGETGGMRMVNVLIVKPNGGAAHSMLTSSYGAISQASGEWFTLNDKALYIASSSGTPAKYAYYLFNDDELTAISESSGMPMRFYKVRTSDVSVITGVSGATGINVPNSGTALPQLVQRAPSGDNVGTENPNVRDMRLVAGQTGRDSVWYMPGNCYGGIHKYRFDIRADGTAEFVVFDFDQTHTANIYSKGNWFTVGNTSLHIVYKDGKRTNFLYTVGKSSTTGGGTGNRFFSHIALQDFERGDIRQFQQTYNTNCTQPVTSCVQPDANGYPCISPFTYAPYQAWGYDPDE